MSERKKLSALDATLLVMGGIIGVGIFFTPAQIAGDVPQPLAVLSLWLFGGVIAMAAAFTFAELGAALPDAGGWFVWLRAAFGRYPAFLFAWVVLAVVSTGATAAVAQFCAEQLQTAVPGVLDGFSPGQLGGMFVLVITLVGLAGVKRAALLQNVCMVVKLTALAALIVCGVVYAVSGEAEAASGAPTPAAGGVTVTGWLGALLPTFFAYGGWQMVAYIAPEVRDPVKTLPRAIVLGVLGVVLVYVSLNLSLVLTLGVEGLAHDGGFAARVAGGAFGPRAERALAAGIAVSALGWCVVNLITAPWLYVAMAKEKLFFESLGHLTPRTGVPAAAFVAQALVTGVYLSFSLDFLVDAVVFVEWIFHGLAALALLRLRRRGGPWPYRSPLYPLAPVVYLVAALTVVGHTLTAADGMVRGTGIVVVVLGTLAYHLWTGTHRRAPG